MHTKTGQARLRRALKAYARPHIVMFDAFSSLLLPLPTACCCRSSPTPILCTLRSHHSPLLRCCRAPRQVDSRFFISTRSNVDLGYSKIFDGKYVAFGLVLEGMDVVERLNNLEVKAGIFDKGIKSGRWSTFGLSLAGLLPSRPCECMGMQLCAHSLLSRVCDAVTANYCSLPPSALPSSSCHELRTGQRRT
jgi:hypothetical protein